jgi:hypothetical protein
MTTLPEASGQVKTLPMGLRVMALAGDLVATCNPPFAAIRARLLAAACEGAKACPVNPRADAARPRGQRS